MGLNVEFSFDEKTYRHYMNGTLTVMHCHHYMSLLTKLAEDLDELGGTTILSESVEDSIRPMLDGYAQKQNLATPEEKLKAGAEYYSVMGMGLMEISGGEQDGTATLYRSHVDQGWLKKWGKLGKPINHWSRGYVAAVFASAFGKPPRSYEVEEVASIVKGDKESQFRITLK
jgi:predicted hydrocarbon binding protein